MFAPRLLKVLPLMTASIVEKELLEALIQSARAPLMVDPVRVQLRVDPKVRASRWMLLLPVLLLLALLSNLELVMVSRSRSLPLVLSTRRLLEYPSPMIELVIVPLPAHSSKARLPS